MSMCDARGRVGWWVLVVGALAGAAPGRAIAEVRLPAIIGSGMVLQQESDVPLWGWAAPGTAIRVQADWLSEPATTTATAAGEWSVRLRTPKAGGPYKLTIDGDNTVTLEDVLIGEVWICSGQSNMEWSVGLVYGPGVENYADVIRAANHPDIRLFDVENAVAVKPARDCNGKWQRCTPETLPPFSAIGFFFGRRLHEELHVPIGLIGSNWSGTPAEAWTSEATMSGVPKLAAHYADDLALVAKERAHSRRRVGLAGTQLPPRPPLAAIGPNTATTLYNGMIAPLVPFGIRGVIWYQGESNRNAARLYRILFPAMISDWRRSWAQGDFPFYYVQIAPFAYGGDVGESAEVREAQRLTLAVPNTGMVVTLDIGNPRDIHPGHKDEVGRRLALCALAKTYGQEGLVCSGPLYRSMDIEDNRIRLHFDNIGAGLVSRDGKPLTCFTIAGAERHWVPAVAEIDGGDVLVSSEQVSHPVAVRFAWGTADEPNLSNREGLPASSFSTDD